jgi:hypothetical protein
MYMNNGMLLSNFYGIQVCYQIVIKMSVIGALTLFKN